VAAPKRTEFERERDLTRTADLYLRGKNQQQIADVIGVSRQQISTDLKEIRRRWRADASMKFDDRIAMELAKIDKLEDFAWSMLDKTNGLMREAVTESGTRPDGTFSKTAKKVKESAADARWAKIINDCGDRRARLLGYEKPQKVALTDADGKDLKDLSPEEKAKQAIKLLRKVKGRVDAKAAALPTGDEPEPEGTDEEVA